MICQGAICIFVHAYINIVSSVYSNVCLQIKRTVPVFLMHAIPTCLQNDLGCVDVNVRAYPFSMCILEIAGSRITTIVLITVLLLPIISKAHIINGKALCVMKCHEETTHSPTRFYSLIHSLSCTFLKQWKCCWVQSAFLPFLKLFHDN